MISAKNREEILVCISKLEAIEFLGLAKFLEVPLYQDEEQKEPRDFTDMLEDVLKAFNTMNRIERRKAMRILRATVKSRGV